MEIVTFLIENKAIVNIKDDMGSSPLHDACYMGHLSIVKYLIIMGGANHMDQNEDVCQTKKKHP